VRTNAPRPGRPINLTPEAHRTGHSIGLDVHERPYLVKGDKTVLQPGMTFSNEPTICIYGEFGVRLEDHMVITETGARWFTQPAHSVDDPFGWISEILRMKSRTVGRAKGAKRRARRQTEKWRACLSPPSSA
jgi:Metallopeptidase family M24